MLRTNAKQRGGGEDEELDGAWAAQLPTSSTQCPIFRKQFEALSLQQRDESMDYERNTMDEGIDLEEPLKASISQTADGVNGIPTFQGDKSPHYPEGQQNPSDEAHLQAPALEFNEDEPGIQPSNQMKIEVLNVVPRPPQMLVKLYNYQMSALTWMLSKETCKPAGGILADDVGLGKTVTTLSLITSSLMYDPQVYRGFHRNSGGTLVVCPTHLMQHWMNEILSKTDIRRVTIIHRGREMILPNLTECQVVITNYDAVSRDYLSKKKALFMIYWKRAILDDAHVIINRHALKSICVAHLMAQNRWALTSVPINPMTLDIFPILRFLKVRPIDDLRVFNTFLDMGDPIETIRSLAEEIMLRRTRDDVVAEILQDLPPPSNCLIRVKLTPAERRVHDRLSTYSKTLVIQLLHERNERGWSTALGPDNRGDNGYNSLQVTEAQKAFLKRRGPVAMRHVLPLIMRLRQVCCHPGLISWDFPERDLVGRVLLEREDFEATGVDDIEAGALEETQREVLYDLAEFDRAIGIGDNDLVCGDEPVFDQGSVSSKIQAVLRQVQEIVQRGEKVIIVSNFERFLQMIGQQLKSIPGVRYGAYVGMTSFNSRKRLVHQFNKTDVMRIMLVSLRVEGQWLNLTAANHVILADVHWNPQMVTRARNMVSRHGQMRDVFMYMVVCENSIEERILGIQERNLAAVEKGGVQRARALGLADIRSLFNV
ncbi:transcription termination factor 2 [Diachasma alloeum]|uniref:transcription termination factor 2 n=1 Tax=Diachasma alloeum TaxID=454923 RepID=UPI0007384C3E|nr:transcription termination factor 2 [Diachasma alloeum]